MLHSSEILFGEFSNQQTIKEGLGGALDNRFDSVKHYKKSEHKYKKYLNALKKQNKILYSISKKSGSHRELRKIKKIKAKASKKRNYSSVYSTIHLN